MLYTIFTSALVAAVQLAGVVSAVPYGDSAFAPRNVAAMAEFEAIAAQGEFAFHMNDTDIEALNWAFGAIEKIPDSVLEAGDTATNKWLQENGYRPSKNQAQLAAAGWWEKTKCAGAIAAFIGSNLVSATKLLKVKKYLKEIGGIKKSAGLLLRASTWSERMKIGGEALVGLAAEILGFSLIKNNCT